MSIENYAENHLLICCFATVQRFNTISLQHEALNANTKEHKSESTITDAHTGRRDVSALEETGFL